MLQEAEKSFPVGELPLFAGSFAGAADAIRTKEPPGRSARDRRLRELDRELASLRTYVLVARNGRVREALRREAERVARRRKRLAALAAAAGT